MRELKAAGLVCAMIISMAISDAAFAQSASKLDLTFDNCMAAFTFSPREADFAVRTQNEWLCSFLLYSSDTNSLNIEMSHEECLVAMLSNLWRLEIHAQLGRDTCRLLAIISENPELLTPTPTRTPRATSTSRPTVTPLPTTPSPTRLPAATLTPAPKLEVICGEESDATDLYLKLVAAGFRVELERLTYVGREWAGVVGQMIPRDILAKTILRTGLGCSIK